ncbi:MAG: PorT family protein [Saprospiraceae bacterium]|nr:PorT family protein [Saprospiraceae bacterium]
MKKSILALVLFSCASFATISAQTFSLGGKVGYNWNNVAAPAFNGTIDFKNMTNTNFGLVAQIGLTDNFSIQPELNYLQKGFRINEGTDLTLFNVPVPVGVNAVTAIKYVEMPLLAKYKFRSEGASGYVFAGPSVGYALSGNLETHAQVIIDFKVGTTPINLDAVDYKRLEVGGVVGAGFEVPIGNAKLFGEARYTHGFNQVYTVPVVGAEVKNKGFGVSAGFAIPISGGKSSARP